MRSTSWYQTSNKKKHVLDLFSLPQPELFGWTNSTIVFSWLAQLLRTWTNLIANRILDIQQVLLREHCYHVKPNFNPADCASRGTLVKTRIQSSSWWYGPDWFSKPTRKCVATASYINDCRKPERLIRRKKCETVASAVPPRPISRYSSLPSLHRIITTVIKASRLFKDASAYSSE